MRRNTLYAPRVKGDLDLGLEPSRIGGDGIQRWAQATWPGGLLPGGVEQGLLEYGSDQNYRIGTRRVVDERVFRYTRVGDQTASGMSNGLRRGICVGSENCLTEVTGASIITCAAGAYVVTLDMSAAVDMWGAAVTVAVNEYRDGYFTFYANGTSHAGFGTYWGCKILSNTAEDGSGYVTFYLEEALPVTAAGTDRASVCQNPWWKINIMGNTNGGWTPCVGVFINHNQKLAANTLLSTEDYLWVQTWGPCPGIIMGRGYGIESKERMLYVHGDGTAVMVTQARSGLGEWPSNQPLGWLMNNNYNGGSPYDMSHPWIPVVFLMIAP